MDDRTQPGRDKTSSNRSTPSAPGADYDEHHDGRYASSGDERESADRSSSTKPALTERERRERWPVD